MSEIKCVCGINVSTRGMASHLRGKAHADAMLVANPMAATIAKSAAESDAAVTTIEDSNVTVKADEFFVIEAANESTSDRLARHLTENGEQLGVKFEEHKRVSANTAESLLHDFQREELKRLESEPSFVATPESITFQGVPMSAGDYERAVARTVRRGQKMPVALIEESGPEIVRSHDPEMFWDDMRTTVRSVETYLSGTSMAVPNIVTLDVKVLPFETIEDAGAADRYIENRDKSQREAPYTVVLRHGYGGTVREFIRYREAADEAHKGTRKNLKRSTILHPFQGAEHVLAVSVGAAVSSVAK